MINAIFYALIFVCIIAGTLLAVSTYLDICEKVERRKRQKAMIEGLKTITDKEKMAEIKSEWERVKRDLQVMPEDKDA